MKRHEKRTHHQQDLDNYFSCELCPKQYTAISSLNIHVQSLHENERKHKCLECGKAFIHNYLLKRHVTKKHEGKVM